MNKRNSVEEKLIINKMRKEDSIELPMDDAFFEQMHNKIMLSVAKTEVKPLSKWAKTWVFLEKKTHKPRMAVKKTAKLSIVVTFISLGAGLFGKTLSVLANSESQMSTSGNKSVIVSEAEKDPMAWAELAASYQNESDFYAEVLSEKDFETIVEIDKVLNRSL